MNKRSKGMNIYFIVIAILLLVTIWVSTIQDRGDSYSKSEFVVALEEGKVASVTIHPNAQVPTGVVDVYLTSGVIRKLNVSDVV